MTNINTVDIVGLGALGVLYADFFTRALGADKVRVLADTKRAERYRREGILLNGEALELNYVDAAQASEPADLMLFCVKFGALEQTIAQVRHLVGENTTIISVLNGIASEEMLAEAFGREKIVWCVAQKMASLKEGNRVTSRSIGNLALGVPAGMDTARLNALTSFMDSVGFPYELPEDIWRHMWSKLLCNTGCNQILMVYETTYSAIQVPGPMRDEMVEAMREVLRVGNAEGVALTEEDVTMWLDVLDHLAPDSEPSMRQDGKAHRKSEVELFSGTICRLGRKHNIPTPVNDSLYQRVKEMEAAY